MKLDFTTLYVIVLLNSVGFALVWAVIALSYRSLLAARYWFAALVISCVSGPILILGENSQWWNYFGNILIILSFCFLWQGVRIILKQPPAWYALGVVIAVSALAMIVFGSSGPADNLIFAASQLFPMAMAVFTLLRGERRQTGTWVAIAGCGVMILGQGSEAVTNGLRLAGIMNTETYYSYASWFLVCAIIGISIANLGFILMGVDRLRGELHMLATRDELTGLPNRRALNERLVLIEKRARRLQQNVAVLMMDLNKFKSINDDHGHPAGDAALKHIADVAKNSLREMDFLARIGGDEFCILMPDTDLESASTIADEIATALTATPFQWHGLQVPLSASIGLNHWDPSSGMRLDGSLSRADEALLQIKRGTRKIMPVSAGNFSLLESIDP